MIRVKDQVSYDTCQILQILLHLSANLFVYVMCVKHFHFFFVVHGNTKLPLLIEEVKWIHIGND